jgi:hypothetical protein
VNEEIRVKSLDYLVEIAAGIKAMLVVGRKVEVEYSLRVIYHQASRPEVSLSIFKLPDASHYLVPHGAGHGERFYWKRVVIQVEEMLIKIFVFVVGEVGGKRMAGTSILGGGICFFILTSQLGGVVAHSLDIVGISGVVHHDNIVLVRTILMNKLYLQAQ